VSHVTAQAVTCSIFPGLTSRRSRPCPRSAIPESTAASTVAASALLGSHARMDRLVQGLAPRSETRGSRTQQPPSPGLLPILLISQRPANDGPAPALPQDPDHPPTEQPKTGGCLVVSRLLRTLFDSRPVRSELYEPDVESSPTRAHRDTPTTRKGPSWTKRCPHDPQSRAQCLTVFPVPPRPMTSFCRCGMPSYPVVGRA
jgi:hypothetical protein